MYCNPVAASWVYGLHLLVCDEVFVLSFTVTKMVHQGRRGCSGDFCRNDERMRKSPEGMCWGMQPPVARGSWQGHVEHKARLEPGLPWPRDVSGQREGPSPTPAVRAEPRLLFRGNHADARLECFSALTSVGCGAFPHCEVFRAILAQAAVTKHHRL